MFNSQQPSSMSHMCITQTQWVNLYYNLSHTIPITALYNIKHDNNKFNIKVYIHTGNYISHSWAMESLVWFFFRKMTMSYGSIHHRPISCRMLKWEWNFVLVFIASIKKFCHAVNMNWLQIKWHVQNCQKAFMMLKVNKQAKMHD